MNSSTRTTTPVLQNIVQAATQRWKLLSEDRKAREKRATAILLGFDIHICILLRNWLQHWYVIA